MSEAATVGVGGLDDREGIDGVRGDVNNLKSLRRDTTKMHARFQIVVLIRKKVIE